MATAARILVLLMAALAFANAQCLVSCAIQPPQDAPMSHCHPHSCGHGQFARTAEVQAAPVLAAMDNASPLPVIHRVSTEQSMEPIRSPKPPDLPTLQVLRI
jgi:hypothetical protein